MKHLILTLGTMFLTFGIGVGIDRLIWQRSELKTSTAEKADLDVVKAKVGPAVITPPVAAETPAPMVFNYAKNGFVPDGAYYWIGRQPKEFAEFMTLELFTTSIPGGEPYGYGASVYTNVNDPVNHPAIFGVVTDRRVFIIASGTNKSDFEYHFDGEFVRKDFQAAAGKDQTVLQGTLTKYKDDKKVAETYVSFRFVYMGC